VARNGKTSRGEGKNVADFYAYGLPVLAPASGVVRVAYDQDSDRPIGKMEGYKDPSGNHVVLEVASRQFVYLCHLKPGSIKVQPSEKVVEGQELARVGNSGHTSEPHLHIHLQDSSMPELAEGIPLYFHHYRTGSHYVERGIPRGGFAGERFAGEVVENVDAPEPSRPE
jgi:murein DD-endopeptidase MepM/ murein hydrolase activator NlpD